MMDQTQPIAIKIKSCEIIYITRLTSWDNSLNILFTTSHLSVNELQLWHSMIHTPTQYSCYPILSLSLSLSLSRTAVVARA